MTKPTQEEQDTFDKIFKPLLYDEKGLNKSKLIKMLAKHHQAVQEIIRVYHHVTGGIIMDILTPAEKVIETITALDNQNLEGILKDEKEKWLQESLEQVEDTCLVRLTTKQNNGMVLFTVTTPMGNYGCTFNVKTNQISTSTNKPLPQEWHHTVIGAIMNLMNDSKQKQLMAQK